MARATAAGLVGVLAVGIDASSSQASLLLSPTVAVGIQPNSAAEAKPGDWDEILEMADRAEVVALGETGLDRYWDRTPFPLQEEYFARHLTLSRKLKKALVIHCREAEADTVRMLKADFDRHGPVRGVMHSYCGDADSMHACLLMGLYVSFAGMITYNTAANLRELAKVVPLDRLLVETDCPYLAPVPERGKRNEPAFVRHTAACIAKSRGLDPAEIGRVTTANARTLFSLTG